MQVIGIAEHHLRLNRRQLSWSYGFDRGEGSYGHKAGRLDQAVGRREGARPRCTTGCFTGVVEHGRNILEALAYWRNPLTIN